ncbi:MAG: hypothetical protein HRT40_00465 [Campylobacteraceae bacterium]|nr:hypothetical protein [Campylobacteraceae bacterium]
MKLNKLLFLLLPFSLYSYEVNFDKTFTKDLKIEILSNNFLIKLESNSEKEVLKILKDFEKEIKNYKTINKKFDSLTVKPNYKYRANRTPKLLSYIGSLKYEISTSSAKDFNNFISKMVEIKDHRSVSLLITDLSWKVKESSKEIQKDELRIEAIKWIKSYSQTLSLELDSTCSIKSIKLHSSNKRKTITNIDASEKYKKILPSSNLSRNIDINAYYVLDCK